MTPKGYHKRYSTALRKMTSTVLLKHGKNDGIAVHVPKKTILKEMAAKIKLSQHFFLDLVRELSNSTSYVLIFTFKTGDEKIKASGLNGGKHYLKSVSS
jgi:3-methyladenine DNA glycosylase AlkD